jgi:16S rRNA (guanine527-N7)-methyltransferase
VDKFNKYYELLVFYNNQFNITAITEKEDVYKKHFIDSILGAEKICGKTLLDVGSGGGFPALPLKIVKEDISLTMLEATGKKCEFLTNVKDELNLENVCVINGRAEEFAKNANFREKTISLPHHLIVYLAHHLSVSHETATCIFVVATE